MKLAEQIRCELRDIDKLLLQMAGQRSAIINHLGKLEEIADRIEGQVGTDVKAKLDELVASLTTLRRRKTTYQTASTVLIAL